MRIRNVKNSKEIIDSCPFLITEVKNKYFSNNKPIILEVGMGKGQFLIEMAKENPNLNFIGVEKYDSIIALAIKKISEYKLDNLLILREDALNLEEYFNGMIKTIRLNFSDPWPKKRHEKRRLTSATYLKIYDKLYKDNAHLILKTDNIDLFAYSLMSLNNYGYKFDNLSLDLHSSDIPNIKTEYEEKFSNLGYKINYLECSMDDKKQ